LFLERRIGVRNPQLTRHTKVNDQQKFSPEPDEDELPPPANRFDSQTRDGVDEHLGLGVPDDRGKKKLAAGDRATDKVRPQVVDDGFYFW
jgi:hypothetical protein